MRRSVTLGATILAGVLVALPVGGPAGAQTKKLVYWTHWDQQPDFNKWYAEKGKEFAAATTHSRLRAGSRDSSPRRAGCWRYLSPIRTG